MATKIEMVAKSSVGAVTLLLRPPFPTRLDRFEVGGRVYQCSASVWSADRSTVLTTIPIVPSKGFGCSAARKAGSIGSGSQVSPKDRTRAERFAFLASSKLTLSSRGYSY